MEIWIGMELSGDEIVQFSGVGCEDVCKSVDRRVSGVVRRRSSGVHF